MHPMRTLHLDHPVYMMALAEKKDKKQALTMVWFLNASLPSVCISLSCTTTKQTHPMDFTMYQFALMKI